MNVSLASPPISPHSLSSASLTPEQLLKNAKLTERQKLSEATRQFEAILLRQILQESQKSSTASHALGQGVAEFYKDLTTGHMADAISRSGDLGLAAALNQQMARQVLHSAPKADDKSPAQPDPSPSSRP